jgi:cytochrome c556
MPGSTDRKPAGQARHCQSKLHRSFSTVMNSNNLRLLRRFLIITALVCTQVFAFAQDAGSEAAATALLKKFLATGADRGALTKELRPASEDYAKVFTADFAKKLEASQKSLWDSAPVIGPKEGQTALTVAKATTEDFQKGTAAAKEFPGGYAKIGDKLQPDVTLFRFKFVKPGETSGMAFDGLAFVNGHWRIFPKPWRAAE